MQQSLKSGESARLDPFNKGSSPDSAGSGVSNRVASTLEEVIAQAVTGDGASQTPPVDGIHKSANAPGGKDSNSRKEVGIRFVYPAHTTFDDSSHDHSFESDSKSRSSAQVSRAAGLEPSGASVFKPLQSDSARTGGDFSGSAAAIQNTAAARPAVMAPLPKSPANDDQQLAPLSALLNESSFKSPIRFAILSSLAWIAVVGYYGWLWANSLPEGQDFLRSLDLALLFMVGILPAFSLCTFVMVNARFREMRALAASMAQAAFDLSKPEVIAKDAIASVGQAVQREVSAIGDGIEKAVNHASKLETSLRNEVSSLEQAYENHALKFRRLINELAAERKAIMTSAEQVRGEVSLINDYLGNTLSSIAGQISDSFSTAVSVLDKSLTGRVAEINASLSNGSSEIISNLSATSNEIVKEVLLASQNVVSSLEKSGLDFTSKLDDEVKRVDGVLAHQGAQVIDNLSGKFSEFSDKLRVQVETLGDDLNSCSGKLLERVDGFSTQIEEFSINSSYNLDRVTQTVSQRNDEFSKNIEHIMIGYSAQIDQNISFLVGECDQLMLGHHKKFGENFEACSEKFAKTLGEGCIAVNSSLDRSVTLLGDSLREGSESVTQVLAAQVSKIQDVFASQTDLVRRVVNESVDPINQELFERISKVDDLLGNRFVSLIDDFDRSTERFNETLAAHDKNIHVWLDSKMEKIGNLVAERSEYMVNQAVSAAEKIDDTLKVRTDVAARVLTSSIENVAATLGQQVETFENIVSVQFNSVLDKISDCSNQVATVIDERGDLVFSRFETVGGKLCDAFSGRNEEVIQKLSNKGMEIAELLIRSADAASKELAAYEDRVIGSIQKTGNEVETGLKATLGYVTEVTKNLDNTISSVGRSVVTIGEDFEKCTNTLERVMDSVVTKVYPLYGQMDSRISALRQLSDTTLSDISAFTSRFQEQGTALSDSLEKVSNFSKQVGESLGQQTAKISDASNTFSQEAGRIDASMRNLSDTISTSLSNTETCIFDITSSLSQKVANSVISIQDDCQSLLVATEKSVESVDKNIQARCESLQTGIEATLLSIKFSLGDVSKQFDSEIKVLLDSVQSVRDELKGGFSELPDAAKEAASNMHRLVSDQIRALEELGKIVSRYSGESATTDKAHAKQSTPPFSVHDSSTLPQENSMFITQDVAETHHKGEFASRRDGRNRVPSGASKSSFLPSQSVRSERFSRGEESVSSKFADLEKMLDSPSPKQSRLTAGKWSLPELLANIREGEELGEDIVPVNFSDRSARAQQADSSNRVSPHLPPKRSFSSLSADLARDLDDLPVDLWQRYRRGEQGVLAGHMHILRNRSIFKDVQVKYEKDPEFRGIVDRYVSDFEVVLDNALRTDPSGNSAQDYLDSEAGKIYLTLAYASYRFS